MEVLLSNSLPPSQLSHDKNLAAFTNSSIPITKNSSQLLPFSLTHQTFNNPLSISFSTPLNLTPSKFPFLRNSANSTATPATQSSFSVSTSTLLFPKGSKNWLVCVSKPSVGFSYKAQAVDFYVYILTQVLGNEKDAQMCIYHVSWQSNFGFCCVLDEESAKELAAVPGVLSVKVDEHFESENKDYGGGRLLSDTADPPQATDFSKTKLFITGLSFYTSEKTLRAAFEPFGELVEVKVIMDKISKRSKGYAFVEYTTEEAATTALREMNSKIINGWMIVVDRAKTQPRYNRGGPRPSPMRDR